MKKLSGILTLSAFIVGLGSLRGYSCDLGTNWQDEPNDVWLDMDCGSPGTNTGNLGDGGFNRFTGIANSGPVQSASSMQSIDTRQNPGVSPDYFVPSLPSGVAVVSDPVPASVAVAAPIDPANNPFDPFSSSVPSSIGDVASAVLVPSFPIMQSPTAFQDPGYLALVAPTAPVLAAPDPVAAPVVVAAVQTPLQQAVFGALPAAPAFQDSVPTVDAAGNPNDVARQPMQVAEVPSNGIPTFSATATAGATAQNIAPTVAMGFVDTASRGSASQPSVDLNNDRRIMHDMIAIAVPPIPVVDPDFPGWEKSELPQYKYIASRIEELSENDIQDERARLNAEYSLQLDEDGNPSSVLPRSAVNEAVIVDPNVHQAPQVTGAYSPKLPDPDLDVPGAVTIVWPSPKKPTPLLEKALKQPAVQDAIGATLNVVLPPAGVVYNGWRAYETIKNVVTAHTNIK
jgi:hypothetical protein